MGLPVVRGHDRLVYRAPDPDGCRGTRAVALCGRRGDLRDRVHLVGPIVAGGDPDGKPDTGAPVMFVDGAFQLVPTPPVLPERMTKAAYAEYLQSPHWQYTRQ